MVNMQNLTQISTIKNLLAILGTRAKKSFGQHFLINEHVLETIIKTAQLDPNDTVFEIGPGLGVLTQELCAHAKNVIAIEKDDDMVSLLPQTIPAKNLTIIHADALDFDPAAYPTIAYAPYKLIANLPYNVATPILEKFLHSAHPPTRIVVLIQKEVAEKICATSGDMNVLALTIQPYATPRIIATVPQQAFYPHPRVTSSILLLEPRTTPLLTEKTAPVYFSLIHAAFSQKRKTLLNSLQKILNKEAILSLLEAENIASTQRPQRLSLAQWLSLAKRYTKHTK